LRVCRVADAHLKNRLEILLPLWLDASNPKDKAIIDALCAARVSEAASFGAPGGVAALPAAAPPESAIVDAKDVILRGTKDVINLVMNRFIRGCVVVEGGGDGMAPIDCFSRVAAGY